MTVPYDISIVVPTVADDAALAQLLQRIRAWSRKPREVVVADGAHSDSARDLCEGYGAIWVPSVSGRSVQLMKGATRAHGSILWFLPPDAEPHPDSLTAIAIAVDSGAVGGYFRWRFTGPRRWYKWFLELGIRLRSRWGVPSGDQGLFFAREAFDVCGGYAPTPLFEQVPLVKGLRRQGRFDALSLPIGVCDRRWQRDGWLRRAASDRLLALGYMAGLSPARLARWSGRPGPDVGKR